MNFNNSFRALLVTSLLFGILFLTLWSIKLSAKTPEKSEAIPIEYLETYPEIEEKMALTENVNAVIETNRAYNEAEKFIKESEQERLENPMKEENTNPSQSSQTRFNKNTTTAIEAARKRLTENKKTLDKEIKKSTTNGYSRKTTISYSLKSREAISLKNPVYTCEGGGKIIINITVSRSGNVVKTSFNKKASTTTNMCLIESATQYAMESQFSKSTLSQQIGSITYNFPGQG
jgi:hypothetical protein